MRKNLLVESSSLSVREPVEAEYPQTFNGYDIYSEDRAHWRVFLSSVRRYLWLIVGVTVLCTGLTALYMARQPDLYEAEAQVQVDLENINTSFSTSKNGPFVVNPVNDPAYFNTQLQILVGQRLIRRVVKSLDLEHDPAFSLPQPSASLFRWRKTSGKQETGAEPPVTTTQTTDKGSDSTSSDEDLAEATRLAPYVEAIRSGLKVDPVKEVRLPIKETRLINITYNHSSPQTAAKIVNGLADTFVLSNLERKTDNNETTGNILEQRIAELQTQIRSQENQLLEYAKNHQILSLDAGQNTVVERLTSLNRQLLEAENERKVAEAAYKAALAPGAADALAAGTAQDATEAESRLAQLWQRRSQLLVDFKEEWPEVQEIDKQIELLEKQIKEMRNRATAVVITNLSTRYRQALAREQSLRTAFNQQRGETLTQNEAAVNYRIIQQEIETNRGLLQGMLQRSKENDAALAAMRNNINVNDHAIVPQAPVGPKRMLYTSVAFALSLGFGVGLAVFLGFVDNSVRSTEDVENTLHLRTLAAIPSIGVRGRRLLTAPSAVSEGNGNGHGHHELLLDENAPAPLTEACRQLRTSMLLSAGRKELKSLLITSSEPSEGKTTMAVNTAVSLARTGALVLVIDADLRKPRLHTIFGLKNEKGLTTILSDELSELDALKYIQQHEKSKLDVLTSGPILPDSAELLGAKQMRRLIAAFRGIYDYVVIDSPPIAYFADGVLLSSLVDGVVLVVNSGKSTRETVRHSYQLLQDADANTCGVILNNVKKVKYDYKYYFDNA
jgi:polysaccharide biosynthesis transport protein